MIGGKFLLPIFIYDEIEILFFNFISLSEHYNEGSERSLVDRSH